MNAVENAVVISTPEYDTGLSGVLIGPVIQASATMGAIIGLKGFMVAIIAGWKRELVKAIRQSLSEGHLKPGIDAGQLVFEIYGLMLAMHQDARLLRSADSAKRARAGVRRLIDSVVAVQLNPKRAPSRRKPARQGT